MNKNFKKDDLRLDSKNETKDEILLNISKEGLSFLEYEHPKNEIFSEKVKNFIKSKDSGLVSTKADKNNKY